MQEYRQISVNMSNGECVILPQQDWVRLKARLEDNPKGTFEFVDWNTRMTTIINIPQIATIRLVKG